MLRSLLLQIFEIQSVLHAVPIRLQDVMQRADGQKDLAKGVAGSCIKKSSSESKQGS